MLFLANLLGSPVVGKTSEPIGVLDDLIVRIDEAELYPPISGLVVRDRRRRFFVPASHLATLNGQTRLNSSTVDLQPFRRRDGEVLLGKDVLDHQIIDITGRRIVRVNDVQVTPVECGYRVVGVDVSPQALLRRLGPRRLAERVVGRTVIDWSEVQYLASAAPVQLKVSYDRLADLHPVDLARIVDALSYRESAEIVANLDDETAAEALEEVSDERLADLLEGMGHERAADILEEMAPNAAADVLDDLDEAVAERILAHMEPEEAADVQTLLAYDEFSVGRIMTTAIACFPPTYTVGESLAALRVMDEPPDPLLAIYVISDVNPRQGEADAEVSDGESPAEEYAEAEVEEAQAPPPAEPYFVGMVRLRHLLLAPPATPLAELMDDDVPGVRPDDPAELAARLMGEYNLLTIPVLDTAGRLLGVVTVDDALAAIMPDIWRHRGGRAFA